MVTTVKEEMMLLEEGENRGRTERDIYAGKGGSLKVIVCWEAVVQRVQGKSRKERHRKFG